METRRFIRLDETPHYNERGKCSWCGRDAENAVSNWCGDRCAHEFRIRSANMQYVRRFIFDRDGGVCAMCGGVFGVRDRWLAALRKLQRKHGQRQRHILWMISEMRRWRPNNDGWEVDHIIPVAGGGGLCGEGGLQTLCVTCHREKTAVSVKGVALFEKGAGGV